MSLITKREFLVRDKVFSVSGKKAISDPNTKEEIGFFKSRAIQLAKKFRLTDLDDNSIMIIAEKGISFRATFNFYEGLMDNSFDKGQHLGKLKKKIAIRMKFWFEDPSGQTLYEFKGNFRKLDYQITNSRGVVAEISKKFFAFKDTYGVRIMASCSDREAMLLLSMVAALDVVLDNMGR
ncbi:MAG: LURP-one-related/scramblase family protein [Promethearchaeota archaeon]